MDVPRVPRMTSTINVASRPANVRWASGRFVQHGHALSCRLVTEFKCVHMSFQFRLGFQMHSALTLRLRLFHVAPIRLQHCGLHVNGEGRSLRPEEPKSEARTVERGESLWYEMFSSPSVTGSGGSIAVRSLSGVRGEAPGDLAI